MKVGKSRIAAVLLLSAAILTGCGGGSAGIGSSTSSSNPYEGTYTGTFKENVSYNNQTPGVIEGTWSMTVSGNGAVAVNGYNTYFSTGIGYHGPFTYGGTIGEPGDIQLTNSASTVPFIGVLNLAETKLTGNVTESLGQYKYTYALSLTKD